MLDNLDAKISIFPIQFNSPSDILDEIENEINETSHNIAVKIV